MKKPRFIIELLFVVLSFVLVPTAAKAALWDVPTGLNPGDTFRWVFVTSQMTQALSSDISDYNVFVNKVADDADTSLTGVGFNRLTQIDWRVIGSTPTVNAIDNIDPSLAAIYNPMGDLVADSTTKLFSEVLKAPILYTEKGVTTYDKVWTGTFYDGNTMPGSALGDSMVRTGCPVYTTGLWISDSSEYPVGLKGLYAISEDLTVVPVPGALMLVATGLLSLMGLKRLRHKHQE